MPQLQFIKAFAIPKLWCNEDVEESERLLLWLVLQEELGSNKEVEQDVSGSWVSVVSEWRPISVSSPQSSVVMLLCIGFISSAIQG